MALYFSRWNGHRMGKTGNGHGMGQNISLSFASRHLTKRQTVADKLASPKNYCMAPSERMGEGHNLESRPQSATISQIVRPNIERSVGLFFHNSKEEQRREENEKRGERKPPQNVQPVYRL